MPRDVEAPAPTFAVGEKARLGQRVVEILKVYGDGEWARVREEDGREARVQLRLLGKDADASD